MLFSAKTDSRPSVTATTAAQAPLQAPRREVAQAHPYHNFSFPIMKTWGNQRVLRSISVNGKGEIIGSGAGRQSPPEEAGDGNRAPEAGGGDEDGIKEEREKLPIHLREAADRMKRAVQPPPPPKGEEPAMEADREAEAEAEAEPSSSSAAWPWKLRTRRRGARAWAGFEQQASGSLPVAAEKRAVRPRSGSMEQRGRPDFSITLTREEIDEDIYAVTGYRARRRPRKRPRVVQKQLDLLFPGAWLSSEITLDSYKVPE